MQVYLEPGESSVYNAGVLVSSVLDIVRNEMEIAIMDASAEDHMPDVLLMPYRPDIMASGAPNEKRLYVQDSGPELSRGGRYGRLFLRPAAEAGRQARFSDMALYSIVKSTTFNGINLPDIAVIREGGKIEAVKTFGYRDYRGRQS